MSQNPTTTTDDKVIDIMVIGACAALSGGLCLGIGVAAGALKKAVKSGKTRNTFLEEFEGRNY